MALCSSPCEGEGAARVLMPAPHHISQIPTPFQSQSLMGVITRTAFIVHSARLCPNLTSGESVYVGIADRADGRRVCRAIHHQRVFANRRADGGRVVVAGDKRADGPQRTDRK